MNATPAKRVASTAKKGGRNSQCVIAHGMRPAIIAGATTKNSAEPRTAVTFDMSPPNSTALAARLAGNRLYQTHGPADRATTKQDECGADGEDGQNRFALVGEGPVNGKKSRHAPQQMADQGFAAKDAACATFKQHHVRPRLGDIP